MFLLVRGRSRTADSTRSKPNRPDFRKSGEVRMASTAHSNSDQGTGVSRTPSRDLDLDHVRTAIEGIRYGEVRVIIQDGVIVQIERVEKQRLR